MTKKILTNINTRLTLGFHNVTFGKSGNEAHGQMFMFKKFVNTE